ncbi:hypothetical protein PVIIG_02651 [Plasmodium vivax India VII]|uniref:Gamma-tubulin complex component n=1 Tax=Plasmodium vivax India VII TaxID=1077284 RepID=A0A0J9SDX9_PLAVI|nr:hypothetical protein PVIIG_02651 [Plasmodium vivax India VII]
MSPSGSGGNAASYAGHPGHLSQAGLEATHTHVYREALPGRAALGTEADLSRADVSRADAIRADFNRADFNRADFNRADVNRADVSRANFNRADGGRPPDVGRPPAEAPHKKEKEEPFKSITHFAKYLFFIAKKIAHEDVPRSGGTTTHQNANEELKKALVKHLIYKLNTILSSLINFNILQYSESVNVKQEVEYLCLKNSNVTLNRIRLMLSKLESSGTNYRYVLYILLKLHSFDEQTAAPPRGVDQSAAANHARSGNPPQGTLEPERRATGSAAEPDSQRYAPSRGTPHVGVSQRKEDPHKGDPGSQLVGPKLVDPSGGQPHQGAQTGHSQATQSRETHSQTAHDGNTHSQITHEGKRYFQPPPEGRPFNQRAQDGGEFRLSVQGHPPRSDLRSDPRSDCRVDPLCERNFINKSLYATIILNSKFNNLDVEESLLMKDLIYPLQGMSGQYIRYDPADRCFYVSNRKVSIGMHHLVNSISSVGLLFRRIKKIVGISSSEGGDTAGEADDWGDLSDGGALSDEGYLSNGGYLSDGGEKEEHPGERRHARQSHRRGSLVIDALHQIVREYINEYYKLLSHLESDINEHIHKNTLYIGVKRLHLRLQESYKVMRVLMNVVDESRRSTGCKFLSFLYAKCQTYDYDEQKVYRAILQRCLKPVNAILKQWVDKGTLKDKYNETFICSNKNVPSEKIWCYKFCLNSSNIPLFLSVSTAKRILLTGKSVHLLNSFGGGAVGGAAERGGAAGGEATSQLSHNVPLNAPLTEVDVFSVGDVGTYVESIEGYVKKLCVRKNKRLISMLVNRYGLYEHFKAFRHFLLLVDGDLFETIFDNMKADLYMDAEELKRHYLNSKLDLCIKSSSVFTSNQSIINKLVLDRFQVKRGDIGWDVLVFDFMVERPLDIIFTQRVKTIYKSINVLLIKLKKIHYELANIWYLFTHLFKIMNVVCYNHVFIYCNIMRNEMFHFIQNLLSYFYYDVIDMNWREFKGVLFNCHNLDRLIHEHYQYITQIQFDLFLGSSLDGGGAPTVPPSSASASAPVSAPASASVSSSTHSDGGESTSDGYLDGHLDIHLNNSLGSPPPGGAADFVYAPSHVGEPTGKSASFPHPQSQNGEGPHYTPDALPHQTGSTNSRTTHNVDSETNLCMYRILDIITRFINLTSALISSVCEGYAEIKQLTDAKKEERNAIDSDVDYVNSFINNKIIGEKTIRDLKILLKYYRNYLYKFICLLLSDSKSPCPRPRNSKRDKLNSHRLLAARLDFNLYYVNISKLMDAAPPQLNISGQIRLINRGGG